MPNVIFSDDFNALCFWQGPGDIGKLWSTNAWFNEQGGENWSFVGRSTGHSYNLYSGSLEWFIDDKYAPTQSVRPWTIETDPAGNSYLDITIQKAPPEIKPLIGYDTLNGTPDMRGQFDYTSGEINTFHTFNFQYGFVEMRAQMPAGVGAWAGFWLMPQDGSNSSEIDVVETRGADQNAVVTNVHTSATGEYLSNPNATYHDGVTTGMHTYGVDWTAEHIDFYFDGQLTAHYATPADLQKPMHIILDLAYGGGWQGPVDPEHLPTPLKVDWVRVYDSKPYASPPDPAAAAPPAPAEPAAPPADAPYIDPQLLAFLNNSGWGWSFF
jgi:hypothetical protein